VKVRLEELEFELDDCTEEERRAEIRTEISLLKSQLITISKQSSKGIYKKKCA
jgi:hypothetical protein